MHRLPGWKLEQIANTVVTAVFVLVPFHAFLTVWASTFVGHYILLRLWDNVLLLVLAIIACWWLVREVSLRAWFAHSLLVRLIFLYAALTILLGIVSITKGEVGLKALAYGLLINLRFLVWFLAALLAAQRSPFLRRTWPKLLLVPAAVVVVFAGLQFTVLPHNFLAHFGYNAATTIAPIETINHNARYIRVQSTLRGANPLGAYIVIVLSVLAALYLRGKRKAVCIGFGSIALLALYVSGSRSAWLGALLAVGVVIWLQLRTRRGRMLFVGLGVGGALLAAGGYVVLRSDVTLQNEILHTQTHSAVKATSNGAHASALKDGLKDVTHQPLGDGPGTAGPASVYNTGHSARIAEDYYVQVAQETGWIGLALLLAIFVLVGTELYERVGYSRLALATLASFIGLAFVSLLSHAWADDTLAYIWWTLAAIVIARQPGRANRAT